MQDLVLRDGEAFPSLEPSIIVRMKTHGKHNSADSGFSRATLAVSRVRVYFTRLSVSRGNRDN